jgi:hypothetical protein
MSDTTQRWSKECNARPGSIAVSRTFASHTLSVALAAVCAALVFMAAFPGSPALAASDRIVSLPQDNILVPDDDQMTGVVVIISDADGWDVMEQAALDAVALEGAIGVGVDLRTWRAALSRETEPDCLFLVADIERIARELHRRHDGDCRADAECQLCRNDWRNLGDRSGGRGCPAEAALYPRALP